MDITGRWAELVNGDHVPLDEAAFLISASANPALDVDRQMQRLDQLAERVGDRTIDAVCRLIFDEMGFVGDRATYDDPANSYLDQVLDRRKGIPITLAVLLMEASRRCGLPLEGVGMPGHFLVRDPRDDSFIDAFAGGRRMDRDGCARLLAALSGGAARLTPGMLETTGPHAILGRMLANLDRAFELRQDRRSLMWVCDLRAALPGLSVGDRMHLAGRLSSLGRYDAAAEALERAAQTDADRDRLLQEALRLRAKLN